jgi:hypothetical protein
LVASSSTQLTWRWIFAI